MLYLMPASHHASHVLMRSRFDTGDVKKRGHGQSPNTVNAFSPSRTMRIRLGQDSVDLQCLLRVESVKLLIICEDPPSKH